MSYAFHMRFGLPQFTPASPGVPVNWFWRTSQPAQAYFIKRVPVAGYGGVEFVGVKRPGPLSQDQLGLNTPAFG